jgi:hypothetical protein
MRPTLDEAIDAAAAGQARGARCRSSSRPAVTRSAMCWCSSPGTRAASGLEICATSSIGEEQDVLAALADWIARATG